ncbi:uncharacterized protein LOC126368302 [Pectinophora gossypiella]|uniref:uncharacterized protein LOC126368302 n=1 Tax=Pectinophora gossypiella TaxID=13191 RepID=UPI00214EC6C2|nr:uncharacterized protein LOC126368302 [Pectinophora gossypiella]
MSTMDNQYYYKLMASYLSKRNCDESFVRYFLGKSAKKSPEELERADERKRRLQRERSRRYRALKNARRQHEGRDADSGESRGKSRALLDDELSDPDEPPTLCDLNYDDTWAASSDCASDDNSAHSSELKQSPRPAASPTLSLHQLLSAPNSELDYPTVHSLMFHWLQT